MKKEELCSGTKAIRTKSVGNRKWKHADHIPIFNLNCVINPFSIAATLWSTFIWIAFGARIEATQAVLFQAITQIDVITEQPAIFVILLCSSAKKKKNWFLENALTFSKTNTKQMWKTSVQEQIFPLQQPHSMMKYQHYILIATATVIKSEGMPKK